MTNIPERKYRSSILMILPDNQITKMCPEVIKLPLLVIYRHVLVID